MTDRHAHAAPSSHEMAHFSGQDTLYSGSARDVAGAFLRTVAYSNYRNDVEQGLFKAEEYEIVVKSFPPLTFASGQGVLSLNYEKMGYDQWPEPIRYAEITSLFLDDNSVLKISYQRQGKHVQAIKMSKFPNQQEVLDTINHYYGRYLAAAEYQKQKRQEADSRNQAGPPG